MATHVIIDGYNLIGHAGGLRGDLRAQRDRLTHQLAGYHRRRGHRVTVVFDGWRAGWSAEHEERLEGVRVIYSREGEPADEVIARLARDAGASAVVVSSDRAVQSAARAAGGVALSCGEFLRKLGEQGTVFPTDQGDLEKDETAGWTKQVMKKGNPRRRSKAERRKEAKLRKL